MRIVIELKKDAYPKVVLNQLFKHTQLQVTFGVIMLALDEMRPVVMNLKELMERFLEHREEVITRRTKYDLAQAEERAHILEGLQDRARPHRRDRPAHQEERRPPTRRARGS